MRKSATSRLADCCERWQPPIPMPAMVDVADSGDFGQSWTYGELLAQAERLARALATRFEVGDRVVVWAPNIP